jgi:hypothetical protein
MVVFGYLVVITAKTPIIRESTALAKRFIGKFVSQAS